MRTASFLSPAVALVLGISLSCWSTAFSAEEAKSSPQGKSLDEISASFKDKILLLEVDRSSALESKSSSAVIKNAEILLIGDRYFVQGQGHAPEGYDDSWYVGTTVGMAWNHITRYYVMTPEQFEKYAKRWTDRKDADTQ